MNHRIRTALLLCTGVASLAGLTSAVVLTGQSPGDDVRRVYAGSPATNAPVPAPVQAAPGAALQTPLPATLPVPSLPTGALGSVTNPLGSPLAPLGKCAAAGQPASSLVLSIGNNGFSAPCYNISSRTATTVDLQNNVVNNATGLPVAVDVTISTLSKPVVAQVAGTGSAAKAMAGLTVPSQASAILNLNDALVTSPTATDDTPVVFALAALPPGQYLLQVPTVTSFRAAVLTVSSTAPTSGVPVGASSGTSPNQTGARTISPSLSDTSGIVGAFQHWEHLPATCAAEMVAGSEKVAVTNAGVEWAIARFMAAASCTYTLDPGRAGGQQRSVAPSRIGPFSEPSPPLGVFEKAGSTASWVMNDEGGSPFPCPAPGGAAPGNGNGAIPAAVLTTWRLAYPPNCAFPVYEPEPRG